jgi:RNA polymerase sigma-70 factor (ECF subfamily)
MFATIEDAQVLSVIPACQRGDAGAVARLYDLYAGRIYHYVLARTGDPHAAEDLTADVFLRVVQHVQRFKLDASRPASSVSAWLYRIAANLVADYHRARQRRPLVWSN